MLKYVEGCNVFFPPIPEVFPEFFMSEIRHFSDMAEAFTFADLHWFDAHWDDVCVWISVWPCVFHVFTMVKDRWEMGCQEIIGKLSG